MTASVLHAFGPDLQFTPWWWEAAPPRPRAELSPPPAADVAVVGAGYTGLSAALTLARAGRHTVVLDADAPGHGASSRNGGQVGSGNQKFSVATLKRRFGANKARALIHEGLAMLRYVGELIEREAIDCHYSRVGRFRGAIAPAHYEAMARDLEDLHGLAGVEFFMVPRSEQRAEIGTDWYWGGSVLPDDAALHPALFHRGLLERAEAAGAEVVPHTEVTGIERDAGRVALHTSRGRISAGAAVITTNGYTGATFPTLGRRILPIGSAILATEELAPEVVGRLMPKGRVVGNTARVLHYYRTSPDGRRILFGGRVADWRAHDDARAYHHLYREMIRLFPELAGVRVTHCWSGKVAYTRDLLPHLGGRDGVYHATGYCGTGVSRSTYFGNKIALKLLGRDDGHTAFDDMCFPSFPFRALAERVVPLAVSWNRFRDGLDRRR